MTLAESLDNFNRLKTKLEDLIEISSHCAQVFSQLVQYQSKLVKKNKETVKSTLKGETKHVCYSILKSYSGLVLENSFSKQYNELDKKFKENKNNRYEKLYLIQSIKNEVESLNKNQSSELDIENKYYKFSEDLIRIEQHNMKRFIGLLREFIILYSNLYSYSQGLCSKFKERTVEVSKEFSLGNSSLVQKSNAILNEQKNFKNDIMKNIFAASETQKNVQLEKSIIYDEKKSSSNDELEFECFNSIDQSRVAPNTIYLSSRPTLFKFFTSNQTLIEPFQNENIQAHIVTHSFKQNESISFQFDLVRQKLINCGFNLVKLNDGVRFRDRDIQQLYEKEKSIVKRANFLNGLSSLNLEYVASNIDHAREIVRVNLVEFKTPYLINALWSIVEENNEFSIKFQLGFQYCFSLSPILVHLSMRKHVYDSKDSSVYFSLQKSLQNAHKFEEHETTLEYKWIFDSIVGNSSGSIECFFPLKSSLPSMLKHLDKYQTMIASFCSKASVYFCKECPFEINVSRRADKSSLNILTNKFYTLAYVDYVLPLLKDDFIFNRTENLRIENAKELIGLMKAKKRVEPKTSQLIDITPHFSKNSNSANNDKTLFRAHDGLRKLILPVYEEEPTSRKLSTKKLNPFDPNRQFLTRLNKPSKPIQQEGLDDKQREKTSELISKKSPTNKSTLHEGLDDELTRKSNDLISKKSPLNKSLQPKGLNDVFLKEYEKIKNTDYETSDEYKIYPVDLETGEKLDGNFFSTGLRYNCEGFKRKYLICEVSKEKMKELWLIVWNRKCSIMMTYAFENEEPLLPNETQKELVYNEFKIKLERSKKISETVILRKFKLAFRDEMLPVYQYHHLNFCGTDLNEENLNELMAYHDQNRDPFSSGANKEFLLSLRNYFHRINSDYNEKFLANYCTTPFFIVSKNNTRAALMLLLDIIFNGLMSGPKEMIEKLKIIHRNKNMIGSFQQYLFLAYLHRIIEKNKFENN